MVAVEGDRINPDQDNENTQDLLQVSAPAETEQSVWQVKGTNIILQRKESLELLQSIIGVERTSSNEEASEEICRIVGDRSLGIRHIGRALNGEPDMTLEMAVLKLKDLAKENYSYEVLGLTTIEECIAASFLIDSIIRTNTIRNTLEEDESN